jgi:two-component system OmpR family response regulator
MLSAGAGKTVRVLVVDEHAGSRFVMCHILKSRGYLARSVGTAVAALAAVDAFRPDAVLLEWHLRGGAGVGLAAKLRSEAARLGGDVLIIVTSTQDEPEGFCAAEGVDAYLVKPIALDQLAKLLRTKRDLG